MSRLEEANDSLASLKLVNLSFTWPTDLEYDVGLLPHRRGTVHKSSARLIVRFVVELGLGTRALLDNDLTKAFLEQEGNILGSDSNASFIGIGFAGNANGELAVWSGLWEDGSRVLCASSRRC